MDVNHTFEFDTTALKKGVPFKILLIWFVLDWRLLANAICKKVCKMFQNT